VVLANGRLKCGACDFGGSTELVHLVGVSISLEKNFYRLPFTPPPLWSPIRSFTRAVCQPYPASDRPDGPPSGRWSPWCPPCRAHRPRSWAPRRIDGRRRAQVQAVPSPVAYLSRCAMAAPAPAGATGCHHAAMASTVNSPSEPPDCQFVRALATTILHRSLPNPEFPSQAGILAGAVAAAAAAGPPPPAEPPMASPPPILAQIDPR
jgi:hypothetical protein